MIEIIKKYLYVNNKGDTMLIKKWKKSKTTDVEVFRTRIGGKNVYFVSKITPKKIATGQARNKKHALSWAKRLVK